MTTELERQLSELGQGEHLCPIHENMAESIACAAFVIKAGLARGDRCVYIAADHCIEALLQSLEAEGINVARERERGGLLFLTKRDTYHRSGKFDPQEMIALLRETQAEALANGFFGLRWVGEMSWALGPDVVHDRLLEYEALLNKFLENSRSVVLCQYDRDSFSPAVIHDMLLTHPLTILGDQVCPNPFYYPPDLALRWQTQPPSELMAKRVDWRIRQLKEARRAAQERELLLERLHALSRRLLKVQEDERRHLARELHDEFGQILATITLHLHSAAAVAGEAARPRLDECAKLLQAAGEQVRNLAIELRPTTLDTHGLEATLHWLAEQHQQRTGCEVKVMGHLTGVSIPPDMSIACFRVVQEALTNVARHAAARHVWIELSQTDGALELVVRDDGMGFDVVATQKQAASRGSLGLLGMAERVQLLGGSLHVESEPGQGTRVRASFPLSEVADQSAGAEE